MSLEKPWLLKVLNGPNAGAQILISKEVTIGTSLQSDLILNDPHIAATHCKIEKLKKEEGFQVIASDGAIFINGIEVSEKENLLKLGDVLTLGSTHLTGGPSEELWPPIKIPEIKEIGSAPQQEEKNSLPKETSGELNITKKKSFSNLSLTILVVVGACVFMGLALFKWIAHKNLMLPRAQFQPSFFDQDDKSLLTKQQASAEAVVALLKKKFPKNTIKVVQRNEGTMLYIYVHDQLQNDYVRKTMNEMSLPIACNIINISDIDDSGLAMMKALHFAVSMAVDENTGKVTWNGYLPNEELFNLMKSQIQRDLPAITEEEFQIILGEDAREKIRAILSKNYFSNITITPERENITLTGMIGVGESMRWEKVLKELDDAFKQRIKFSNMVTINSGAIRAHGFFNAPVVSISISSFPYAILQNGERIFLGARANNGYVVDSITSNGIELVNHGERKIVPLMGQSTTAEIDFCK